MSGTMRRVMIAFAAAGITVAALAGGTASTNAATPRCPAAACLTTVLVTDGARGMGAPFLIEDNEKHPPGQNAVMFWVDGFQVGSVNPVCADATYPYLARQACLGGPPFYATGGHPVISLSPDNGKTWVTLTVRDIRFLHYLERRFR